MGLILLQIYPSEYGLEKMNEENVSGPSELWESHQLQDNNSDDDGNTVCRCFYFSEEIIGQGPHVGLGL